MESFVNWRAISTPRLSASRLMPYARRTPAPLNTTPAEGDAQNAALMSPPLVVSATATVSPRIASLSTTVLAFVPSAPNYR